MAKNMARIEDGVVVNIEWCANACEETDTLKNINDLIVVIGDTYDGSSFYHNGEKLLTLIDKLYLEIEELDNLILDLQYNNLKEEIE